MLFLVLFCGFPRFFFTQLGRKLYKAHLERIIPRVISLNSLRAFKRGGPKRSRRNQTLSVFSGSSSESESFCRKFRTRCAAPGQLPAREVFVGAQCELRAPERIAARITPTRGARV